MPINVSSSKFFGFIPPKFVFPVGIEGLGRVFIDVVGKLDVGGIGSDKIEEVLPERVAARAFFLGYSILGSLLGIIVVMT